MKVVLRSRSLWFTVLSILLNVPTKKTKRQVEFIPKKPPVRLETPPATLPVSVPAQQSKYWNRVAL
jgi:hypothetical protein